VNPKQLVVLVSGGSKGLGEGIVTDLLAQGHIVATFSRARTSFIERCEAADPAGKTFVWKQIDGSDFEATRQFGLTIVRRYGRIDALINNAACIHEGLLTLQTSTQIHQMVTLNLEAVLHLCQVAAGAMLKQRSGCILNISSLNAVQGHGGVAVYSATKAALDGLTRSLARELGPRGVRVNSLAPGYFESDMASGITPKQKETIKRRTPLGRLGTIPDLVGVVRFLLSDEARFMTGQTIVVDGGITV
jgi:3-oxoacyl-[acyl-carrier protein] reductase